MRRTPALPLRPQTAQHGVSFALRGVYLAHPETARKSPHSASAGSTGSTAGTPWVSSLSARCSSISRFPLLRRITTEMPILLSASRFCTICRDTFLGEIRSTPTGSIRSDSSVGVPINSVWSCISSERRETMRSPSSSGCVRLSDTSSQTFSLLRSSVSSRYSMSRPMQESFALPLPAVPPPA